jgi:hypothetical protein
MGAFLHIFPTDYSLARHSACLFAVKFPLLMHFDFFVRTVLVLQDAVSLPALPCTLAACQQIRDHVLGQKFCSVCSCLCEIQTPFSCRCLLSCCLQIVAFPVADTHVAAHCAYIQRVHVRRSMKLKILTVASNLIDCTCGLRSPCQSRIDRRINPSTLTLIHWKH